MTRFALIWSESGIREFVIAKTAENKPLLILFILLCSLFAVAVPFACVIEYAVSDDEDVIIIGTAFFMLGASFMGAMYLIICSKARRLRASLTANSDLYCDISERDILLWKNGSPYGSIEWDRVAQIIMSRDFCFILTSDGILLALEKRAVVIGSYRVAEIILKKQNEVIKQYARQR